MAKNQEPSRKRIGKCYLSRGKYRNLRNYFEECTSYSSLHGVKYLGEKNRTLVEKIGWLIVIIVMIVACSYFVHQTYKKWETTPILVTVGSTQLPIQYVTFPAVTICPSMKTGQELVDVLNKFDKNYGGNLTDEDILRFKQAQMWCQYTDFGQFIRTFKKRETYNLDTLEFIYNNTPPMSDTFWTCQWSGERRPCSKIFTPTFTEEGVCYTFNNLDRSKLFEMGVLPFRDFNTAKKTSCYDDYDTSCRSSYPYRTTPGVEAGLQVFLKVVRDNLNPCMDVWKGHKVVIHQPTELPSTKYNFFYIPLTESVTVAITPQVITTDGSLRTYTVEQRKCYYDDEKNLTHFKYYSQMNCEAECYLYATKLYWNCSDFYMPHIHLNTQICNATNSYSLRRIGHHIKNHLANLSLNIPDNIQMVLDTVEVPQDAKEVCNCLPSCKSLKYNSEITQTDYDIYDKPTIHKQNDSVKYSKLSIYFKDSQFIPYERKEMFGLMDFVAYCGGLLGLFIGFSFIAFLEIVYFICFRPLCNIYLFGRKFWAGKKNFEITKDPGRNLLEG